MGGHQASSASVATLLTALYLDVLAPRGPRGGQAARQPRLSRHPVPLGRQSRENLERFRAFGGAQAYPSRTKDADDVDFSTGSVGLGVALTLFASLVQDYVRLKGLAPEGPAGRMVAVLGDAELDEGNVFEAMLEGWKHDVRNLWWVVDYNRQSLDAVVTDRLFSRMDDIFRTTGFRVVTLKYGRGSAPRSRGPTARSSAVDRRLPEHALRRAHLQGGAAWRARARARPRRVRRHPGAARRARRRRRSTPS